MKELVLLVVFASLVVPAAAFGQNTPGMMIETKSAIFDVNRSLPGLQNGSSFFEARISSNDSALMVSAVIVETSGGVTMHDFTGVSVYPSADGKPIAYSGNIDAKWFSSDKSASMMNAGPLPASVPKSGVLGVTLKVSGLSGGDQVKVAFVYMANPNSSATASTIPVADMELGPLDIATVSKVAASPGFMVDDMFSDPETNCEFCTRVVYSPGGKREVEYVAQEMHLEGVEGVQFWARGEHSNETWTFKAAGMRGPDGSVAYANTTSLTLGAEWARYEIGIPPDAADLPSITHLFAFETASNSSQTIYLKGIMYH